MNTKYISSSELQTSEFSRARSTSENIYVFISRGEIYLVFTEKKKQIFFLFYTIDLCVFLVFVPDFSLVFPTSVFGWEFLSDCVIAYFYFY